MSQAQHSTGPRTPEGRVRIERRSLLGVDRPRSYGQPQVQGALRPISLDEWHMLGAAHWRSRRSGGCHTRARRVDPAEFSWSADYYAVEQKHA